MGDMWTIKAALDWTVGYLERKGDENPRLSAEWLLSEACDMSRIQLYVSFDRPLSLEERDILRGYVTRRGKGEPLQYITGYAAFRHIQVKVRPGVLIPRPETEVLVSEALSLLPAAHRRVALDSTIDAWEGDALIAAEAAAEAAQDGSGDASETLKRSQQAISAYLDAQQDQGNGDGGDRPDGSAVAKPRPLLVADICTGSGCIACSVAYERPDTRVIATDIAPEAVALAKDNAAELGLSDRVRIERGDLGSPVPAAAMGRLDLVVSNPPYVPTAVLAGIPREVADFEPALALDGGADGNDILRRLLPWTAAALRPGGGFAFELHETCLDAAAELARRAGFHQVRIVDDLAGRPRVLTGVKPV
ncbi:N5-glutamine methyltransferase family protein [Senegalimassilia anaerobia]|uniref:N5-glutamine methyltransferase family protein n=2 Tax=Senegalimassilia anaerobia TaxID=1473216 RepID=UPI003A96FFC4